MSNPIEALVPQRGYLEFMVSSHFYAIPISGVREINPIGEITPVPKAATHLCGVMNLRGQVLPVVDLKVRLYGEVTFKTRSSCVVVIGTAEGAIGLLVDSVCRVVAYPEKSTTAAPDACHLPDKSLVSGIAHDGTKMITLLSMVDWVRDVDCGERRASVAQRSGANPGGAASSGPTSTTQGQAVVPTESPSAAMSLRSAALRLMD